MQATRIGRRTFLKTSATALAFLAAPAVVRAQARKDLRFLAIGVGSRGTAISVGSAAFGRIVACSDADTAQVRKYLDHLAKEQADRPHVYADYREALARDDVDAVTIGSPDHWHARMLIDAVRAGKDVYVEKPMTLTVAEGDAVCQAVRAAGRVVQVGTQQRSEYDGVFLKAAALARLGCFGPKVTATVVVPARYGRPGGPLPFADVPEGLDWNRWQGPAPESQYCPQRCHRSWRNWLETGCGPLTDWGVHHVDIAVWAINPDPDAVIEVSGSGTFPHGREATLAAMLQQKPFSSLPNFSSTVAEYQATIRFAGGHELIVDGLGWPPAAGRTENGLELTGERGTIWATRSGKEHSIAGDVFKKAESENKDRLADMIVQLAKGRTPKWAAAAKVIGDIVPTSHMDDFVQCVRSRQEPVSDVFSHHRSNTVCQLAHIAMLVGRPVKWDPKTGACIGDAEATALLSRRPRPGFELPVQ